MHLTGIYGESKIEKTANTWKLIRTLRMQDSLPWIFIGDFNEVMLNYEKQGGLSRHHVYMQNFCDALMFCHLKDLGFGGDIFTWRNNNYIVDGYIRESLDRVVATSTWCARFLGYKIVNGFLEHSDHRPVILHVDGGRQRYRRKTHD